MQNDIIELRRDVTMTTKRGTSIYQAGCRFKVTEEKDQTVTALDPWRRVIIFNRSDVRELPVSPMVQFKFAPNANPCKPQEHTQPLPGENIYNTLERLGWKRVAGNSRLDFYVKKNWHLALSKCIDGMMLFHRTADLLKNANLHSLS